MSKEFSYVAYIHHGEIDDEIKLEKLEEHLQDLKHDIMRPLAYKMEETRKELGIGRFKCRNPRYTQFIFSYTGESKLDRDDIKEYAKIIGREIDESINPDLKRYYVRELDFKEDQIYEDRLLFRFEDEIEEFM